MLRARSSRTRAATRAGAALLVLLVLLLVVAPAALGMTAAKVTVNQQVGGIATRFTFDATADTDGPLGSLTFTFPDGFDLSKARTEIITLEGLKRIPVTPPPVTRIQGHSVAITFPQPVAPGSNVRVYVHQVVTPNEGGSYPFAVAYEVNGEQRQVTGLSFSYETASKSEDLARWLDRQAWVDALTGVTFIDLFFKPQMIVRAVPLLFHGWLVSIELVLVAFPLAIAVGLLWAFSKMSRVLPLRWLASAYINIIRGTPLFLQIFMAFIGLRILGFRTNDFVTAVAVLALNSSAYLAEIFRAGIQSIHKGQTEASVSLGMSYYQSMRYVIIPQTVKRVLPTMTSEFILLFKDTALLSAMGIFELMLRANNLVVNRSNLTPYVVAAFYYLIITIPLINYVGRLEARLAVAEGGHAPPPGRMKRGALPPPLPAGQVE